MEMKRITVIIFLVVSGLIGFAQENILIKQYDINVPDSCINKYDSNGLCTGLWIIKTKGYDMTYYKEGKVHGLYSSYGYGRTQSADRFYKLWDVYYNNGEFCGPFVMYHENGVVAVYIGQVTRLGVDEHYQTNYSDDSIFIYKGYEIDYNADGSIKAEGWTIMSEDLFIDVAEVGDWKIYDKSGSYRIENKGRKIEK